VFCEVVPAGAAVAVGFVASGSGTGDDGPSEAVAVPVGVGAGALEVLLGDEVAVAVGAEEGSAGATSTAEMNVVPLVANSCRSRAPSSIWTVYACSRTALPFEVMGAVIGRPSRNTHWV